MDKTSPEPTNGRRLRFSKRRPRAQCAVCLHIHRIRGLPPEMNGQYISVGWRTRGDPKGGDQKTGPVEVCDGSASFDEVLLRYCGSVEDVRSVLKGTVVSASSPGCNMGGFRVDLSEAAEAAAAENLNSENGGKVVNFDLEGIANGGILSIGVYCSMLEEEEEETEVINKENEHASKKQSKSSFKCFSCLPSFRSLRIRRPQSDSVRRVPSARSQPAFISIEDSIRQQAHDEADEEGEGFITIEKGVFCACRAGHPPSDDLRNTDDEEYFEDPLLLDGAEHFDVEVEEVEDEFLRMLEPPHCLSLDLDLDLDGLIKEAEMELNRAAQAWKRRVNGGGGEIMEREEYEELMVMKKRSWGESSSGCFNGFGSPF